jgi:hypothetical protein
MTFENDCQAKSAAIVVPPGATIEHVEAMVTQVLCQNP